MHPVEPKNQTPVRVIKVKANSETALKKYFTIMSDPSIEGAVWGLRKHKDNPNLNLKVVDATQRINPALKNFTLGNFKERLMVLEYHNVIQQRLNPLTIDAVKGIAPELLGIIEEITL